MTKEGRGSTVTSVIAVTDLKKVYGDVSALKGISFEVAQGELFGLLGPNGAGKSTTLNILSTLLQPTSGRALVNGFDVVSNPVEVRRSIGIVFQEASLDERLSAEENLYFHARIYGVPSSEYKRRIDEVLALVDLDAHRRQRVRNFSGGMKRRLEIARGILHEPKLLILDEPTTGLDPHGRQKIWQYINRLRDEQHVTVLLSTHYMDEAEPCDRVAILDKGRLVACDRPTALKEALGKEIVEVRSPTLNDVYLRLTTDRVG